MSSTFERSHVNVPLHGLPVATAVLNETGDIVAANQRFEQLCGQSVPTGSVTRLHDVVAAPHRPALEEALHVLAALGDEAPPLCGMRVERAGLPSLWFELDLSRLGAESGARYLACVRPLGNRRRQDSLADSPLTARASLPSGSLSTRHGVEPWVATLSHEFRGPLQAISGWAQLAGKGALPSNRLPLALDLIRQNAATLSSMIEKLFDLSRGAKGSLVLERQTVDLNSLVQLVVESALPSARSRHVMLRLRRARTDLVVDGDPLRLQQIIRNLVENALKFTPSGGHVQVHTVTSEVAAELVVTDDGAGISPELLSVIFEPSRQGKIEQDPRERGLGLGLALVRELVQLHGGQVRAFSGGTGQGSTFIVRLPLANTAVAA